MTIKSQLAQVDVSYALHSDPLFDRYVIRRVEVVAVCASREEARQWMIDRTEECLGQGAPSSGAGSSARGEGP